MTMEILFASVQCVLCPCRNVVVMLTREHPQYQPVIDGADDPTFDMILGMAFCKWISVLVSSLAARSESHTRRSSDQRLLTHRLRGLYRRYD